MRKSELKWASRFIVMILLILVASQWTSLTTIPPPRPIFVIIWDSKISHSASGWAGVGVYDTYNVLHEQVFINVTAGVGFSHSAYAIRSMYRFIAYDVQGNPHDFGVLKIENYQYSPLYYVVRLVLPK